jgi:GNAT superfamily N-acetyltransferase
MSISIREAIKEDAAALTGLTCQLGYPITETDLLKNLDHILQDPGETVFVALYENKVIGWIGVFKSVHLTSGPLCEISGLVIDSSHRGKGIGRQLVERVKQWSLEQGENILRVRANTIRKEAHRFYYQLGFKDVKDQKVFETAL